MKLLKRRPYIHAVRKSDRFIVVKKPENKTESKIDAGRSGFGGAKESIHLEQRAMPDWTATQSAEAKSSGLARLHQAARKNRSLQFNNLLHHITPKLLLEAYKQLNRRSAKGVDGEDWKSYGKDLNQRLANLHKRIHTRQYRPQPVKRIWIPKPNGEQRPIGVTAVEDKVVQQSLVWVLESIYEADFLGFSYGFRPNRNQHQALDAVYVAITRKKVSWVLDADFRKFFDTLQHNWLIRFMQHRIADKRLLSLIQKVLKAGVIDETGFSRTEIGAPQGAVISPLLANIYLHYALDLWSHRWRKTQARGECYIVRYADDSVLAFQYRTDGEHYQEALKARLEKFGLKLNESKTKLIEFGRFAASNRRQRGESKPDTFDFLGFTHICSKTRFTKKYKLRRITISKKMRAKLHEIKQELRKRMNIPIYDQGRWLKSLVQGYFNYYAVPDNTRSLDRFKTAVTRMWLKALRRRSQKSTLNWKKFEKLCRLFFPSLKVLHPYPGERFDVR